MFQFAGLVQLPVVPVQSASIGATGDAANPDNVMLVPEIVTTKDPKPSLVSSVPPEVTFANVPPMLVALVMVNVSAPVTVFWNPFTKERTRSPFKPTVPLTFRKL